MYYELYLDSFFLQNLIMDYLLLLLTGKLLQCTATHWRIFLGALTGAGMACVIVILPGIPAVLKLTLAYILVSLLMVRLTFRIKRFRALLWGTAYLYFFMFAMAGYFQFMRKRNPLLGYIGLLLVLWGVSERKRKKDTVLKNVEIRVEGKEYRMKGLLDTGNGLTEPVSGKPVSLISESFLRERGITFSQENLRLIPFHSIGKGHGCLEGHFIERLVIQEEDGDFTVLNAVIGVSKEEVSSGGNYEIIINPGLLHGNGNTD